MSAPTPTVVRIVTQQFCGLWWCAEVEPVTGKTPYFTDSLYFTDSFLDRKDAEADARAWLRAHPEYQEE